MLFGFRPSYQTELPMLGDRRSARDAVIYAFDVLGWNYLTAGPDHFRAEVIKGGAKIWGWDEMFSVSVGEATIKVKSSSGFWIIPRFDGSKNQKNVEQFMVHFSHKEQRDFKVKSSGHKDAVE
jgi:hypothetical protein